MTRATEERPQTSGLRRFVEGVEQVLDAHPAMPVTIKEVSSLLFELLGKPDGIPPEAFRPRDDTYARHLLHRDLNNRFVVLALVWRPGQGTPIHDHSCWGVMGLLENSLQEVGYERLDDGSRPGHAEIRELTGRQVTAGSTSYLLPPYQEIHAIGNNTERLTISIHVYGRDIDEVNVFEPNTKTVRPMRIKYYSPECGGADFAI